MKSSFATITASLSALLIFAGCNTVQPPPQEPNPPTNMPHSVPAPQDASISGTLEINGAVVQNTTALMLQRQVGDSVYQTFDRLPAVDGMTWGFAQASPNATYEITVALQVNEEDKATGNVVTTLAPASDLALVVNTDLNLPAPTTAPTAECSDPDSTGGYNPTFTYPNVEGAAGYYYQVGSDEGGDNIDKGYAKSSQDPNTHTTNSTYIKQNTPYYTRYAYTACVDCNVHDNQNWSGWSPTLEFTCPQ